MAKNFLTILFLIFIALLSYDIFQRQTSKSPKIVVTEGDINRVNLKDLNDFKGLEDISLTISKSNVDFPENDAEISGNFLEVKKGDDLLFTVSTNNWLADNSSVLRNLRCTTSNELTSSYYLNSKQQPAMMGLCQEKPSGLLTIKYKGNNRWGNFQYFPWNNEDDIRRKNFYEIYIDLDFDGYFDVRFVINDTARTKTKYIMIGMDWEEMKTVDVDGDSAKAIDLNDISYTFIEDSWTK